MSNFFSSSLNFMESSLIQAETREETALFSSPGVNPIKTLPKGSILTIVRESSEWLQGEDLNVSGFVVREAVDLIYQCKIKIINAPVPIVPRP